MFIIGEVTVATLLPLIVGIAIFAVPIWLMLVYEKKRVEKLSVVAEELGLVFHPDGDQNLLERHQFLPVFNKGRRRMMKNLMTAETDDTKLAIFEYQYTTGGGKHKHRRSFAMASMEKVGMSWPRFTAKPEGFLDRVSSAIGTQDINFDDHPEFSKAFVLQGENETEIREFFNKDMLDLFVGKKDALVEVGGGMLTFRKRTRLKPEQVKEFMAEAYEFLNAFEASRG